MSLTSRFSIELTPPVDPNQIKEYIQRFENLLKFTSSICIVSHSKNNISGFDRAYNLSKALLQRPDIGPLDVTFHLTCHDLNKLNIETRLTLLKVMGVNKVLIITGEGYDVPEKHRQVYFANSTELIEYILQNFPGWLKSIAIASYPGSSKNITDSFIAKCSRIPNLDTVYTQCVFEATSIDTFIKGLKNAGIQTVRLIPSIAVFKDLKSLRRCTRLLRVKEDEALLSQLEKMEPDGMAIYSRDYLIGLCASLIKLGLRVNICTFGIFDITEDILRRFTLNTDCRNEKLGNCREDE